MADNPMDLLNGLLSNPEAIKAVGKMLSDSTASKNAPDTSTSEDTHASMPDFSDISSVLHTEDNGTRLLYALEPYLSSKRKGNINQIVQAVKIGKVISTMSKRK